MTNGPKLWEWTWLQRVCIKLRLLLMKVVKSNRLFYSIFSNIIFFFGEIPIFISLPNFFLIQFWIFFRRWWHLAKKTLAFNWSFEKPKLAKLQFRRNCQCFFTSVLFLQTKTITVKGKFLNYFQLVWGAMFWWL